MLDSPAVRTRKILLSRTGVATLVALKTVLERIAC
jgi:hypothetical protein